MFISLLLMTIMLFAFNEANADSLAVLARNLDGTLASGVAFGDLSPSTQNKLAPQYLDVFYSCNYGPNPPVWGLDIYTNNTGTSINPTGGMMNTAKNDRVVMVHAVYDTTQPGITDPPNPIVDPWVYIIDKNDSNWASQLNNNYPRIVYGFQNGDDFLSRNGSTCNAPVIVYLGGLFGGKAPGTYTTTIYLDLYHL
jgi:hypothetical protein